ncbi:MFS transporter, DHA2 family, metal-tetracycline-proton antiporter [Seinonella peptonophila]|uniref:MFS transporter, DHA2 family, metal-tetracycline-proton antiporter n=1 Tax=Seinonella peptonophila TaxID=112248 RepID=A0A1M5ABI8_9BACL|nr:MFS transporter [Seinonella peptonophila]SHF27681.1 MFS transporter, DHA2 family, metal-tetracycline-proton antiporter [Seinonella peptonophila]
MNLSIAEETKIIRLLCFLVPFAIINSYMLNVSLPEIAKEFAISPSTTGWVITVSGILSALGALIYGKLADYYGIRNLATFGVLLFSLGSLLCFFSSSFPLLLIGRIIQGIGVSSIPSLAMTIPARYITQERRGKALGVVASVMAFAGIIGPILGGILSGIHWRYIFLFSLIIIVTLPFIRKWLPNEVPKQKQKIDIFSAGLLVAFIVCLMESITLLNIWLLLVCFVFFVLFLLQQHKSSHPFIPFHLFHHASYRQGMFMGALNTASNFGVFLITPLFLSEVYGLKGYWIGFLMAPSAAVSALLGKYGGSLTDRKGNRYVLTISVILLSIGFLFLSTFAEYTSWTISIFLVLTEVGYIFMQPSISKLISSHLPKEHSGIGMGVYGLSNFLTIAIAGSIITKAVEYTKVLPLNPLARVGESGVYSNVYFMLFILSLMNLLFIYKFMYKAEKKLIQN